MKPEAFTGKQEKLKLENISDYKKAAEAKLGTGLACYLGNTAGTGKAFNASLSAYSKYEVIPGGKIEGQPDTSVEVLGKKITAPIMIAPTAFHGLFTKNGETDTYAAGESFGTNKVISSFSTLDFKEIGPQLSHAWYQLLMYENVDLMKEYVDKAEKAGCSAIVLTIDALKGCSMCKSDPDVPSVEFPKELPLLPKDASLPYPNLDQYYEKYMPGKLNWNHVQEIVSYAKGKEMPVVLKGILNNEDAQKAVEVGAQAIVVSNHGGRQNDNAPATLEALTDISPDVKNKIDVYLDGGIRNGEDIFKALALGAKAVFIGRPAVYGLAVNGKDGLVDVLNILNTELKDSMKEAGCQTLSDISRDKIYKKQSTSK